MIDFYALTSPNVQKIYIMLEECALPYKEHFVDVWNGDQYSPEFSKINPNNKIPAIVDSDGPGGKPLTVIESGAILLYLAEKTGKFLPPNTPANRGELLSWLMFAATGVGPFSGQSVHFQHHVPEKIAYAQTRYTFEAMRHYTILNERLAARRYVVADTYTIVDMDVWGWARLVPHILSKEAWEKLPHLKRLVDEIETRPAAQRAVTLKDRFTFKTEMDDEARRHMFRHLAAGAA